MVNLAKLDDSAVKFTFTDSQHYLTGDGEITVPLNSLILVLDESNMATFKKVDGDPFISFLISESNFSSKADLEAFYKENMVGGGVNPEDVLDIVESATTYYDGVEYDSVNSRINFKHGNTIEAYVDAAPFIVDGMVSDVAIVNGNLVITFNTDSGKQPISIPLTDIFNPNNYYDKNAVDNIISGITDDIIEDEEVISSALNDLNERKLDASAYTPTDLSNYYNKTEVNGLLDDKVDTSAFTVYTAATNTALSGKQPTLVSGTNIKTINNESILGSGNIDIQGGGSASSAITSGDTNAVQGGAVYDKIDEVEQVTAAALNLLNTNMGGLKFVKLSQQEYDNLAVKDSSTMYVII